MSIWKAKGGKGEQRAGRVPIRRASRHVDDLIEPSQVTHCGGHPLID